MRRSICSIAALVICTSTIIFPAQTSQKSALLSAEEKLDRHVPKWKSYTDLLLPDVIRDSLRYSRIPAGVALLPKDKKEILFTLPLSNPTFRELFNSIIVADARYKWEIEEGVVNFVPVTKYPELLNTFIPEFRLDNAKGFELRDAVERLPEIQQRAKELGFSNYTSPRLRDGGGLSSTTLTNVHCQNCTLRQVLNAIVRAHGRAMWSYGEEAFGGERYFNVDFPLR